MASWVSRMIGAARFDIATYEEVKTDPKATVQAIGVVFLSAAASGLSSIRIGVHYVFMTFGVVLVGWLAWTLIIWLIGRKFFAEAETKAELWPLVRTAGFATSPGILSALGWIPILGPVINNLVWLWMLATTVLAVRVAFNYTSTVRAVGVSVISAVLLFAAYALYLVGIIMIWGWY